MAKNIKARFEKELKDQPGIGRVIALSRAVTGQGFNKYVISRNLKELIVMGSDDGYEKEDRNDVLKHLYDLSNKPDESKKDAEEAKNEGENPGEAPPIIKNIDPII